MIILMTLGPITLHLQLVLRVTLILEKAIKWLHLRGATMAFTGTIATTDQTQSIINNDGNGNGGRRWNLVANPFLVLS